MGLKQNLGQDLIYKVSATTLGHILGELEHPSNATLVFGPISALRLK